MLMIIILTFVNMTPAFHKLDALPVDQPTA